METTRSLVALMRFHWAGGVRLSLRAMVPMAAVGVAAVGMQDQPALVLAAICRAVSSPGFDPFLAAGELGLVTLMVSWARPRLGPVAGCWIRHLPADGLTHRLALFFGLVAVQIPLLVTVALAALVSGVTGAEVGVARIGSMLFIVLAVAWAAAPKDRRVTRPAGWRWAGSENGRATSGRISSRAIGWGSLGPLAYGVLPVAGCLVLQSNNHLDAEVVIRVARFSAGLSVSLVIAGLAEQLGWRRPAWPWVRSLPWSSAQRITEDAWFLGAHGLPLLAMTTLVDWRGALAGLAITPFLAFRGAGLIRSTLTSRAGASGRLMTEGFLIAGLIFMSSWMAWLVLAATPWALRHASEADRDQRVTRWIELRHLADGDTGSWSGQ